MTVTRLTLSDTELEALLAALGRCLTTDNLIDDTGAEHTVMELLYERIRHTLERMSAAEA